MLSRCPGLYQSRVTFCDTFVVGTNYSFKLKIDGLLYMDQKPVILIVDDTASNLQLLAQLLKEDYQIKVANSGQKALELAESLPDLILLDVIMPDMDGYEVCKHLKENDKTKNIPVIFVTGKVELEDEKKGLVLGAVDYITKPFHTSIVEARVKTHITIIQQHNQLQHLAMNDQLTGLYNRHYLMDVAIKKMARARRHNFPLSMILLDIDHFKNINDQHGHTTGDIVLSEIAALLSRHSREEDVAARMGGEEFVLLFEYCSLKDAHTKAELLRSEIEKLMPQNLKVTASFGVVECDSDDMTFELLFGRADKALYEAKGNGRNVVVSLARPRKIISPMVKNSV